ncbi:hypothetical protein LMH87_006467 [Akanthomyces muscarius]|uniref:Uncharacterized protein n=1 Tax=Akanthomyces muscarius TaxID=2231603 RepID=A0A9W8QQV7_AKAMU|nr:hypothetical protein LMH87_006467 [Akanthomyces muscarius]KAJ4164809.1 hypothetical protein LMH87_006467 [Akanthomyces muscarius]
MCINDQYGIDPLPVPWYSSFRNRVAAKIETSPKVYHARRRSREFADSILSKPLPPLPNDDEPRPVHIASVGGAITRNKKTVNKAIRSRNWSQATNATLDMVRGEQQRPQGLVRETMMSLQPASGEAKPISRGPIVRYNRRDQLLELLPGLEQERHEEGQRLRQAERASSATDESSIEIENMLRRTYIVRDTIEPQTAHEIIQGIGIMLYHVPFTIVGNAALVYYGRDRRISRITLACPEDCMLAIFRWAQTYGMHQFVGNGWGDSFGYKTKDGGLYRVRVRSLYREPFNRIRLPQPGPDSHAKVMTLPNIVNEYAGLYAAGRRRLDGVEEAIIASEILWMLRRIASLVCAGSDDKDHEFTRTEVTWVLTRKFWEPFVREHPEAVELFRVAGVFRCLNREGDVGCSGHPGKSRPLPPRPGFLDDVDPYESLPEMQDLMYPDGRPMMPDLYDAGKHDVSIEDPATAASSRAASVREPTPANSSRAVSPEYWAKHQSELAWI